ncbi:hypothetical protein BST81_00200 [Leptolyngbya sp. 'hensonii']|uniref:methyltransferase, TIGR04325 family n=1 Tax=Leptolyngbya sp. 'hensonii' TaxID=1922337 RepID=UPI00094FC904|nr:methyltransferase, TIGR04325 family [Leptolyngbya sp. 'hensonii']OLP20471.1 hypothetical protein BST81_00200 [Leptolyngbya sp. 'hensonii']
MQAQRSTTRSKKKAKNWKKGLRDLFINIPIVGDAYLHYWVFPRSCASCRGVFRSFSQAMGAIPQRTASSYNLPEFYGEYHQQTPISAEEVARIHKFQPIDYPVLVWLREAFSKSSSLFDLGGNTGYSYYAYRTYIPYPTDLTWKVCDLPEAVRAGNEVLQHVTSPGLSYTTQASDAEGSDIYLTCGALQYIEPSLAELLGQLTAKPHHLIIHHVPFYDGPEYITLQSLLESYVPYKIQNQEQFIASLTALGYELVDSWEIDRTCRIPFHPERFVEAYYGFYLRLREAGPEMDAPTLATAAA